MVNDPLMEEERELERQQSKVEQKPKDEKASEESADQPPSYNPFDPIGSIKDAANEDQGSIFITDDDEGPEEIYTVKYGQKEEPTPYDPNTDEERSSAESFLPPEKKPQREIEETIEDYTEEIKDFDDDVSLYEVQAKNYQESLDDYKESSTEFQSTGQEQLNEIIRVTEAYERDINKFNKDLENYEAATEDEGGILFERLNTEYERLENELELIEKLREQYQTFLKANKEFLQNQETTLDTQREGLLDKKDDLEAKGLELQQDRSQIEFQIENMEPTQITIEGQGDVFNRDDPNRAYTDIFGGGSPDTELVEDVPPSEAVSGFSPDLPNLEFNNDEYEDIFGGGSPDTELIEEATPNLGGSPDQELIELNVPQRGDPEPPLPLFGATESQKYLWFQWAKNNLGGEDAAEIELTQRSQGLSPLGGLVLSEAGDSFGTIPTPQGLEAADLLTGASYYSEEVGKVKYLPRYQIGEDGQLYEAIAQGSSPDQELIEGRSGEFPAALTIEGGAEQLAFDPTATPDLSLVEADEVIKEDGSIYRFDKFTGQPLVQNDKGEWITLGDAREELNTTMLRLFVPFGGGGASPELIEAFPFGDVLLADRNAYDKFIQQMLDDSVETVKVENIQDGIVVDIWEEEKPVLSDSDKAKIAALYFGGGALRFVDAAITLGFPLQFIPVAGRLPKKGIRALRNNLDDWKDDYYRGQLGLKPPKGPIDDFLSSADSGFIDDLNRLPVEREADLVINQPRGGSGTTLPQSPVFMADDFIISTDPLTGKPRVVTKDGLELDQIKGNVSVLAPDTPVTSPAPAPSINPQFVDEGAVGLAKLFDDYSAATPSRPLPPRPLRSPEEPERQTGTTPSFDIFETEEQEAEEFLQSSEEMQGEEDPFGTWVDPVLPTLESPEIQVDLLQETEAPQKPRTLPRIPDESPVPPIETSPFFEDDITESPERPTETPRPETPPSPNETPSELPPSEPREFISPTPLETTGPTGSPFPEPPADPLTSPSPSAAQAPAPAPAPAPTAAPAPAPAPAPPPKTPQPTKLDLDLENSPFLDDPPPLGDLPPKPTKPTKKIPPTLGSNVTLDDRKRVVEGAEQRWPSIIQWKQLDDTYATLDLDTGQKEIYNEPIGSGVNQGYLDESLKIIERQRNRPKFQKTEIGNLEITVKSPNVVDINRKLGNINESIARRVRFRR